MEAERERIGQKHRTVTTAKPEQIFLRGGKIEKTALNLIHACRT